MACARGGEGVISVWVLDVGALVFIWVFCWVVVRMVMWYIDKR